MTTLNTKPNLYLSFDIETDGCVPVLHSMISIGFYGLDDNLVEHFRYESNIECLEGHIQEKECMENFWNLPENQTAWNHLQQNKKNYIDVMSELSDHFKRLSETYKLIFVAKPANFDWMFFKSYYELAKSNDVSRGPSMYNIGFTCECASTLWNFYKKKHNLSNSEANKLYKEISEFDNTKEHFAVYDAMFQGIAHVKTKKLLNNNSNNGKKID